MSTWSLQFIFRVTFAITKIALFRPKSNLWILSRDEWREIWTARRSVKNVEVFCGRVVSKRSISCWELMMDNVLGLLMIFFKVLEWWIGNIMILWIFIIMDIYYYGYFLFNLNFIAFELIEIRVRFRSINRCSIIHFSICKMLNLLLTI